MNWTGSSSPASTYTDTAKLGGLESGLATRPKSHLFLVGLTAVRHLSPPGSVRRHERSLTRLADIDDIPLVGKESSIGSIILKIKLVRRITGRVANSPLLVPQQVRGKRRVGDDCIGFVLGLSPRLSQRLTTHAVMESSDWSLPNTKRLGRSFRGIWPTHTLLLHLYSVIDPSVRNHPSWSVLCAPGLTIIPPGPEWLTSEGIIPTPNTPAIPTPAQTPAVPPTPELSNASTPANTSSTVPTPSDRGKKRARREVVSE